MNRLPNDEPPRWEGPDEYRLARAYPAQAAAALVERALGIQVVAIERDRTGGSHAVFFAQLADGQECVARVATHPEHDLARELWAAEQCRALGVPVPEVLAADTAPAGGAPPYAILRRSPGVPAHVVSLAGPERAAVFEQLGTHAARIHSIALPGFGDLRPGPNGYAGSQPSLGAWVVQQVEQLLARLPRETLPPEQARSLLARFRSERDVLDRPAAVLVHGDYRFKNLLRDGPRVAAILDFEMAMAGDPAMDLAWLLYSDAQGPEDMAAFLKGYGDGVAQLPGDDFHKRLLLYQLQYALNHLRWEASLRNQPGCAAVRRRLRDLEAALGS